MGKARARVELKMTTDDRYKDFKYLFTKFKRSVNEYGIMQEQRAREFYESPGRKNRRKKREADADRQKNAK